MSDLALVILQFYSLGFYQYVHEKQQDKNKNEGLREILPTYRKKSLR